MATPNVVFNLLYAQPHEPGAPATDKTKWRDWVAGDLFNYATRKDAVEKETIEDIKIIKSLCDNTELDAEDAKVVLDSGFLDYFDYASNRPGSTGAFGREGDITPEQAVEIKKTLKTTRSIIWTGILSFEEEYGKKFCDDKAAAYAMMLEAFPSLFARSHLKYENIDWYATLHRNTDNRHLHITFWEREPTFLRKGDTEYHYANVCKIKQEACVDFKFSVAKHFEIEALSSYKMRDNIRENLRRNMNTSDRKDILTELLAKVKESNSWQFGKQAADTQRSILQFALGIIDNDELLKTQYDEYVKALTEQQNKYYKVCRENNLPVNQEIKTFADRNLRDLHNRLGNDVLYVLKQFDKEYQRIQRKFNSKSQKAENVKKLTPEDTALLEKIYSKPTGGNFKALFEGNYTTDNTLAGKQYYKTEDAAVLAFASMLIYYTQDKEQFQRILEVSGVYTSDFDENYNGQIDFMLSEKDENGTVRKDENGKPVLFLDVQNKLYKDVLYDFAKQRFDEKMKLPEFDNTWCRQLLQKDDLKVIAKIEKSKFAADFQKIMGSSWENLQHDTKNELQGYHYHCYHFVNLISKFTQKDKQIERLFRASPLFRPTIWDGEYKGQIPFIAAEPGAKYGDTIKKYCIEKSLKWKQNFQGKQGNQRKQGNLALSLAHQSGRAMASIVQNAFSVLNTRFDNSFNQFRNAIKEQERKRKQAEGDRPVNE